MRTVRLTESADQTVTLTDDQANSLRQLGTALASRTRWWGDQEDDGEPALRSVVRCTKVDESRYSVRISDAVGVVGLGQLQLIIDPKIPLSHLLYLFGESGALPRSLLERSHLAPDANFFVVIATWFIEACEQLLRHGLISDYGRVTNDLACARGRIHATATARSVLLGRPVIRCDYDIRSENTSLNRVIRAATLRLLNSPALPEELRTRSRRIQYRLSDVENLRPGDTRVRPDLLTRVYRDVHPLALMLLGDNAVAMDEGGEATWTFLCRTPEPVEAGIRNCLSERLGSRWPISKRGLTLLGDFKRVLNPDLVFGNKSAVGDVKYKVTPDGSIGRSDLNQITTFATGFCVVQAMVIAFSRLDFGENVSVGPVEVTSLNWNTVDSSPAAMADRLSVHVERWLENGAIAG